MGYTFPSLFSANYLLPTCEADMLLSVSLSGQNATLEGPVETVLSGQCFDVGPFEACISFGEFYVAPSGAHVCMKLMLQPVIY